MFFVSGCAIIRPGEVGVKQRLGDLGTEIYNPGSVLINPLTTTMVIVPTRTMNLEVDQFTFEGRFECEVGDFHTL